MTLLAVEILFLLQYRYTLVYYTKAFSGVNIVKLWTHWNE